MKILQINSSLLGEHSASIELSDILTEKLGGDVEVLNTVDFPAIDQVWLAASQTSSEQGDVLDLSRRLVESVEAADVIVIGLPVYNFGMPVGLKNWIDTIPRAGVTFRYTESGPEGLLASKPVCVVYTAGGVARGSDFDHASGHLVQVLNFLGLNDVSFVTADSLAVDPVGSKSRAQKDIVNVVADLI